MGLRRYRRAAASCSEVCSPTLCRFDVWRFILRREEQVEGSWRRVFPERIGSVCEKIGSGRLGNRSFVRHWDRHSERRSVCVRWDVRVVGP